MLTMLLFNFGYIILLFYFCVTEAKHVKGVLTTTEDWIFLDRFCFISLTGKLAFEIWFPKSFSPISLLLYYDEILQWPSVYKKPLSCTEKISPPHIYTDNNQIVQLGDGEEYHFSGCYTKGNMVRCEAYKTFTTSRERWWYIALARCYNSSNPGIIINYNIHMTNDDEFFNQEFSADEFDILQVDIAFLIGFIALFIFSLFIANHLKKRYLFHSSFKLYIVCLLFTIVAYLCMCIAYGVYAQSGLEETTFLNLGQILRALSIWLFILMLLLMAKGITITRGKMSFYGTIKISIFMSIYFITYAILFIYDAAMNDPGEVLYIYESPPGFGILILRVLAWVYFIYACTITLKHFGSKKKFYFPFLIFYSCWFLFEPLFVLLICFTCPKYMRAKIINGIDSAVSFSAFSYFLFLTRPSHSNKNFPYHVKTSQIGITSSINGNVIFSQRNLEPTQPDVPQQGPDFTAIFNVSKKVSNQTSSTLVAREATYDKSNALPAFTKNKLPPINRKSDYPDKY